MSRRTPRDSGVRRTASRTAARNDRKLQLIVNNSHPGPRGLTLLEQMELEVVKWLRERGKRAADHQHALDQLPDDEEQLSDAEEDEYYDWMMQSEGMIKGGLKMLAIMRSTTPKVELDRARIRIQEGDFDGE